MSNGHTCQKLHLLVQKFLIRGHDDLVEAAVELTDNVTPAVEELISIFLAPF
jgi:hypothetical protein